MSGLDSDALFVGIWSVKIPAGSPADDFKFGSGKFAAQFFEMLFKRDTVSFIQQLRIEVDTAGQIAPGDREIPVVRLDDSFHCGIPAAPAAGIQRSSGFENINSRHNLFQMSKFILEVSVLSPLHSDNFYSSHVLV